MSEIVNNGWIPLTEDNEEEVYHAVDEGKIVMYALVAEYDTGKKVYYMNQRELSWSIHSAAKMGWYYYYIVEPLVLPE